MLYSDLTVYEPQLEEGFYTSAVDQPRGLPIHTFLPTGHEPRYAYPLVVFFHGHGGDGEQVLRLAPRLSRRNFICISLRGLRPANMHRGGRLGYSWGADDASDVMLEDYVFRAIEQTCESVRINSRRIYLAGLWEGATLAYRLGLSFPEKFAGVISLNGAMTRRRRPLLRYPEVKSLRVFIGHGIANAFVPLSMAKNDWRLLYTAGMSVEMHRYPTTHKLHAQMLRDVNRWIIDHCSENIGGLYTR